MYKIILTTFAFIAFQLNAIAQHQVSYQATVPLPTPQIFAEGVISAGGYESHPAFSPTGDTLYFVKSNPDITKWTICVSYYRNKRWSPVEVASFSGQYMDADPFVTKNGRELYFISNRPVAKGGAVKDFDIWKAQRTPKGWSEPIRLPEIINSTASEYYPTITDNGTLYFGSKRNGGKGLSDIYKSAVKNNIFQEPENLGDGVNTDGSEYEPFISPDERYIIFMACKPDDLDKADLYIAYNRKGIWSLAKKLPPPFNSSATEFSPKVTRDGKYFFFASARNINPETTAKPETTAEMNKRVTSAGNGLGDIYQVDFSALNIE